MTSFLVLWLATQALAVLLIWYFALGIGRAAAPASTPRVAVIVAVKGHHAELDHFLDHLFAQDYPSYRVIFGVETAQDTAIAPIKARGASRPGQVALTIAGLAQDEAQKVANLRAALAEIAPTDDIVVFADSDIRPDSDWLKRMVAPLTRHEADIVSGFAWLVVKDRSLSTFVMASMAATMVTIPRLPLFNACWGGSTAMWRETCETLNLRDAWRGVLGDDLYLTAIAQRAGLKIAAPRELLPRLHVATRGFGDVALDALRWLMLFRVYMPATYALTLLGLTFAAAGWLLVAFAAVAGQPAALVAAMLLTLLRTAGRAVIVARLWGRAGFAENRAFLLLDPLATPLGAVLNAVYAWRSLFMRRTLWAGVTYEIVGPRQTRVLARQTAA
jgi:hypothetical protein